MKMHIVVFGVLAALCFATDAFAAKKVDKGDDKYAETARPREKDNKVPQFEEAFQTLRPVVITNRIQAVGTEGTDFGIVSYNVRHCEGVDGRIDLVRIAQAISRMRPRYAALQEIDVVRKRTGRVDQAAELARLTGLVPTFAKGIAPKDDGEYGVMLLSEERPLSVRRVPLPGKEPRVLLLCEFAGCFVGTTHLSVATEAERVESVAVIRREVTACGKPVFLTGDWNATPESPTLKGMGEFMTVLSDTAPAGGTFHGLPNKPSGSKGKCIDYVAVDSRHAADWHVTSAEVFDERTASDHAPVRVGIRPVRPAGDRLRP